MIIFGRPAVLLQVRGDGVVGGAADRAAVEAARGARRGPKGDP